MKAKGWSRPFILQAAKYGTPTRSVSEAHFLAYASGWCATSARGQYTTTALLLAAMMAGLASLASGCAPNRITVVVDEKGGQVQKKEPAPVKKDLKLGLGKYVSDKAYQGYTLLAPMHSFKTFLIDMQGRVVRKWQNKWTPALVAYLLPNGNLLRTAYDGKGQMDAGGGGRIQEFSWDGELLWDFRLANDQQQPHHDIAKLPSGNVLVIAWDEAKTDVEALDAGAENLGQGKFTPDCLIEIRPTGLTTGEVVWEWHAWDHLIQNVNKSKKNYGNVALHPELIDINYRPEFLADLAANPSQIAKLKRIGYIGNRGPGHNRRSDWIHLNSVDYNGELDQIMLTTPNLGEIWIIDHSTTTAEAAGHSGGKSGKGGDLLYRWGNPRTYRAGALKDQQLFGGHNGQWIGKGLPGEGHALVFSNGSPPPDGQSSSVLEFVLPVDVSGRYSLKPGSAFGPELPVWSYSAPNKADFFSILISGAQRLPNGNTLICSGEDGIIFEVTPDKEIVWEYVNPVQDEPGDPIGPAPIIDRDGPGFKNWRPEKGKIAEPAGGWVFRAYRYGPDYPAFAGKDLKPGPTIEEMQAKGAKK